MRSNATEETICTPRPFLYELFTEPNKPMPPAGSKQWGSKLTPYQRQVLDAGPLRRPASSRCWLR
jgi:hypothetical protein